MGRKEQTEDKTNVTGPEIMLDELLCAVFLILELINNTKYLFLWEIYRQK